MKKMKKSEGRRQKRELFPAMSAFLFFILTSSFCLS